MLMEAETPTLPDHKVYILELLCLCVLLVLGTACHDLAYQFKLNYVALNLLSVEFVPGSTHQKNCDTVLLHHENFHRPTHLVIVH